MSCLLSGCAFSQMEAPNQQRIFECYAKAALFEFCGQRSQIIPCSQVNKELENIIGETYFFIPEEEVVKIMVLFEFGTFFAEATLAYDKDKNLKVVKRGLGFSEEFVKELIDSFLKAGHSGQ